MTEHTPTPWINLNIPNNGPKIYEHVNEGSAVCQLFEKNGRAFLDAEANAAFIVRACNSHDALVKALEKLSRPHDCGCKPCVGQCTSPESLLITIDEMRNVARAALTAAGAPHER